MIELKNYNKIKLNKKQHNKIFPKRKLVLFNRAEHQVNKEYTQCFRFITTMDLEKWNQGWKKYQYLYSIQKNEKFIKRLVR